VPRRARGAAARRDLLAIGGLALAFFTRPQFLVLAAVLPLAALVVDGPRRALDRHRVLAGACVAAVLVVVPLASLGEAHRLLGDYGVTATQGSPLPAGVWKAAAIHLDVIAIGLGVIPFLLGVAWTYSNLRGGLVPARAFATFTAIALPLLALETASYDLRFGGEGVIRGRYLFYVAPLLLIATAAALVGRFPVWGVLGSTAFFAATVAFAGLPRFPGIYLDSSESVLNGVLRASPPGLPPGVFVAICGVVLGAICLAFRWLPRPLVMLASVFASPLRRHDRLCVRASARADGGRVPGHRPGPGTELDRRSRGGTDRSAPSVPRRPRLVPERGGLVGRGVLEQLDRAHVRRPERAVHVHAVPVPSAPRRPGRRRGRCRARPEVRPGGVIGLAVRPCREAGRCEPRADAPEGEAALARHLGEPRALPGRVDPARPPGVDSSLRGTWQPDREGQACGDARLAAGGKPQRLLPWAKSPVSRDRRRSQRRWSAFPRGATPTSRWSRSEPPRSPGRHSARSRDDPSARSG
jgi:hypothetical protein